MNLFDDNIDDMGYPLCPVYREPVLPDENDLCSLCASHSASVIVGDHYATLYELQLSKESE